MKRTLMAGLLLGLLSAGSGCAMCGNPWDYAYGTYGSSVAREDRFHGRVNSAFESAGATYSEEEIVEGAPQAAVPVNDADLEPTAEIIDR